MVQPRIGEGETVGMMVRMPADLRDRIKAAAETNGRSQNSEIVATLEEKYPAPKMTIPESLRSIAILLTLAESERRASLREKLANEIMVYFQEAGFAKAEKSLTELPLIMNRMEQELGRKLNPDDVDKAWEEALALVNSKPASAG